ncbi:MAG TPA: hydrogen gas-evolving membrane-bound hydrogenase subunit E [Mesorhizobium sp.]|jgi:multicomponent Na+:H+ antiporter subunit A|nr:hydrogen gas-evolving membrane-bound hydrogenase subunit E [Mesorhizobium sp.]
MAAFPLVFFLPFIAAVFAPFLVRTPGGVWALPLILLLDFGLLAGHAPAIAAGEVLTGALAWAPSLRLSLSWRLDGLSLAFALVIAGIGVLVAIYAAAYLADDVRRGRFFAVLMAFAGAMQGLVLADSFFLMFVFWELTAITSFLLIGHSPWREEARRAALQAWIVTGAGGLALLAGLVLLGLASGAESFSELLPATGRLAETPLLEPALLMILIAAFTKSAQVPFHFWLPNAMEAPTPVSAYLHSATMVKAGVYLLLRLQPVLGSEAGWTTLLPIFGAATLVIGAGLALAQRDLKLMLAYSTVASLGQLVMLAGIGTKAALAAATLYFLAHALFKGALFMLVGVLDVAAGTRDATVLSGWRRNLPWSFLAGILAAASMAGLPLTVGFLAKEEVFLALSEAPVAATALTIAGLIGNAGLVAVAYLVGIRPFIGVQQPGEGKRAATIGLTLGPVVLAIAGVVLGLATGALHETLTTPMTSAAYGEPAVVTIGPVPHLGLPLLLSVSALALGLALALSFGRWREVWSSAARRVSLLGPDRGYDTVLRGGVLMAAGIANALQNGSMRFYLGVVFVLFAGVLLLPLGMGPGWPEWPGLAAFALHEWATMLVAAFGLFAIAVARSRVVAIAAVGLQGFALAVLFLLFGAPDLAFTQFMIEILSVVILTLALTRLNLAPPDQRTSAQRLFDLPVAVACGVGVIVMLLAVTRLPFDPALSEFFNARSYLDAHGRNVVNVIIVDFRGLDTLGEIAVVMTAGLAIFAVMRIRRQMRAAGGR